MANIKQIKKEEMAEILNFYHHIEEYGHIFYYPAENLDSPFAKILEGMGEVKKMMKDSWEM